MASETIAAAELESDGLAPGRATRSWVDTILDAIEAIPGPLWLVYVALLAVSVVWRSSVGWVGGWYPVGLIEPHLLPYSIYAVFPFAMLHLLRRTAGVAIAEFAPALDVEPLQRERLARDLALVPAGPAAIAGLLGVAYAVTPWLIDPVMAEVDGVPVPALVVRALVEWTFFAAWFVLIYQVVRQLRLVAGLHRRIPRVDLFQADPLYALSKITVVAGIGFVFISGWQLIHFGGPQFLSATGYASILVGIALGSAAFVLPLVGLHGRLAQEKRKLVAAANERITVTIERLHDAVDRQELEQVEALHQSLSALAQEREIVGRLRTWPWEPGTFAAFASAVALPTVLWLLIRGLEGFV